MPGEISLAHAGVLFLDEFGEFSRNAIEALRQPLESGEVFLHRVRGNYIFPAKPLLVAAMNPCKCGYYPDRERCRCTSYQIQNYLSKISGPIMERMDLCIWMHRVNYSDFEKKYDSMDSETMRKNIENALSIQKERFKGTSIQYNGEMDACHIERYCSLDDQTQEFLDKAYEKYHLSARTRQKILKVARTISDLDNENDIRLEHVAESLCYRFPDENCGGVSWA